MNCCKSIFCLVLLALVSCAHPGGIHAPQVHDDVGKGEGAIAGEAPAAVAEQEQAGPNLEVHKKVLANGLTVLLVKNGTLPIFSYYTFFNVGARYEDPGITGASHFLEHLMFKGAKKYGPGQFDQLIESSGGSSNAFTTSDQTVYYENLPVQALDIIVDLEADRMSNLLLEPLAFESERKVILEERKLRYENSPKGQLFLATTEHMFRGTPYGGSVIGNIPDLLKVSREQILQYFKSYYAPNNATIVVVGDIDVDKTMNLIAHKFAGATKSLLVNTTKEQKDLASLYVNHPPLRQEVKLRGSSPWPIFTISFGGEPLGTRRGYVMDILASILGNGQSSYFHQKYVKGQQHLLNEVGVSNYTLKNKGVFFVMGELLQGGSLANFQKEFARDMQHVCKNSVNSRAVQKVKNQYLIGLYDSVQTNAGIAQFIGNYESYFGDYSHYQVELKEYQSITSEEVMKTCKELFNHKKDYLLISVWEKNPKKK